MTFIIITVIYIKAPKKRYFFCKCDYIYCPLQWVPLCFTLPNDLLFLQVLWRSLQEDLQSLLNAAKLEEKKHYNKMHYIESLCLNGANEALYLVFKGLVIFGILSPLLYNINKIENTRPYMQHPYFYPPVVSFCQPILFACFFPLLMSFPPVSSKYSNDSIV